MTSEIQETQKIWNQKKNIRRIDSTYAVAQSLYWMSNCIANGYLVVYLTYRGATNTQAGITSSVAYFLAILLQFSLSDFLDRHMNIPIKRAIITILVISMAAFAFCGFLPLPVLGILCAYAVCHCTCYSSSGFLNAQLMQFNNVGIEAHYSWPRGCGSITYAIASAVYGILVEKYSAGILPVLYIVMVCGAVIAQLFMIDPYRLIDPMALKSSGSDEVRKTSYLEMIRTNRTLMIFMIAIVLYSLGQTAGYTFIIRIIEKLGGGTTQYGFSEFIRAGSEFPALLLAPLIYKKITSRTGVGLAMLFGALKIWFMVLAPSLAWVYVVSAMNMLVVGLYVNASVVYVNSITRITEKVRAQALAALMYSMGSIVGNLLSGILIDSLGLGITYGIAGSFSAAGGLIMFLLLKGRK